MYMKSFFVLSLFVYKSNYIIKIVEYVLTFFMLIQKYQKWGNFWS